MSLSYSLFAFYTEVMEVSMPSGGAYNLSLPIEEVILWLSLEPFPRPIDPIYTVGPR